MCGLGMSALSPDGHRPSIHTKLKWLPIKVLDLDNLTEKWVGCTGGGGGGTHLVLSAAHPVPKNRGRSSLQKYLT